MWSWLTMTSREKEREKRKSKSQWELLFIAFFFLIITNKNPKQKKKVLNFLIFTLWKFTNTFLLSAFANQKSLSQSQKNFFFFFFLWMEEKKKKTPQIYRSERVRGFCVGPSYETFGFVMSAINTVPRSCALHALARVLLFSYFGCPFVSLRGQVHCCVT